MKRIMAKLMGETLNEADEEEEKKKIFRRTKKNKVEREKWKWTVHAMGDVDAVNSFLLKRYEKANFFFFFFFRSFFLQLDRVKNV